MFSRIKNFLLHNTTTRQTVAKNTFWLFVGNMGARIIKIAIVIYAARVLGATQYGVFTYAIGFAALFAILGGGIDPIITREIAKEKGNAKKIISSALYLRIAIEFATLFLIILLGIQFSPVEGSKTIIPLVALTFFFDSLREFGLAIVRAREKMEIDAAVFLINHGLTVIFGIVALTHWRTPFALAAAYALGSGTGFASIFFYIKKELRGIASSFDVTLLKKIIADAIPFAFLGVTGTILINSDTFMLGWFAQSDQIGYYNAALRPVKLLFVLPALLTGALFPILSRRSEKNESGPLIEKALAAVNTISVPLTVGGYFMAPFVISLLYGPTYLASIAPFKILIFVVLLNFPATIMGYSVLAHNKQARIIPYFIFAAVLNIILNLMLIPPLGILGAAAATLISQLLATSGYFIVLKKEAQFTYARHLIKPLIASSIMGGAIFVMQRLNIDSWIIFISAIILYASSLFLLRDPIFKEIRETVARNH